MTTMFLAQTGGTPQGPGGIGGILANPLFVVVAFFAIMYFLLIRPKQKEQKEHQRMLSAIQKGDRILTNGGLFGLVEMVKEKEGILVVKIAEKVKVEVSRGAVARRIERGVGEEA